MNRTQQLVAAVAVGAFVQTGATAAEELTIGMITTLSGPGAGLGIDIRDAFNLALEDLGGKLGEFDATSDRGRRPAETGRGGAADGAPPVA